MPVCAICKHLEVPPRTATGAVGLMTSAHTILAEAIDTIATEGAEQHVMVNACPEHVVDVYRGRVAGVRMAWRLSAPTTA